MVLTSTIIIVSKDLKMVFAYHLTSVPMTFAHIVGLNMSTYKSTLFSKLNVRIITDAARNVDVCIIDVPGTVSCRFASTFVGVANLPDMQMVQVLHLTHLNIHHLMILPDDDYFVYGEGKGIWT